MTTWLMPLKHHKSASKCQERSHAKQHYKNISHYYEYVARFVILFPSLLVLFGPLPYTLYIFGPTAWKEFYSAMKFISVYLIGSGERK